MYTLFCFTTAWIKWRRSSPIPSPTSAGPADTTGNLLSSSATVCIYVLYHGPEVLALITTLYGAHCYAALLPRRGPHIASHSVCLSVCPSVPLWDEVCLFYSRTVLRANIQNRKTSVFAYGPASHMYFSARAEGRISYGYLGRTHSCLFRMLFLSIISTAYHLLSGSRAARLLLNWMIDWR